MSGELVVGMYIGAGIFLTWALSRELDPKHDFSAILAALLSLSNILYYETIQLLVIGWLLLLLRTVNGITGKQLTALDIFLGLGLTLYLTFNEENSVYLMILLLAMTLVMIVGQKTRVLLLASMIGSLVFVVESFFMDYVSFNSMSDLSPLNLIVLSTVSLSFIVFWFLSKEEAKDDRGNRADRSKVLAGQLFYVISILLLLFFDDVSLNNLTIYLSVLVGILVYYIGCKILSRKSTRVK